MQSKSSLDPILGLESGGGGDLKPLLLPEQAAAVLGVTSQTLSAWRCTKRYEIPFVRVGSRVRYREEDLKRFIQSRTNGEGAGHGGR